MLLIIAIGMYCFAPKIYNYGFSVCCAIQYVISVGLHLFFKKKKNYFDFDCVFFFGYFFVTLFYAVFMYESDPVRFFMFQFDFDPNVIPKASALSLLGINSYILGSFIYTPIIKTVEKYSVKDLIPNNHIALIAAITFLLYIATGGYAALRGAYSGNSVESSGISNYIFLLTPAFLFSALLIDFYNLQVYNSRKFEFNNISKYTWGVAMVLVVMILLTGSRTIPVEVILLIIGLYTLFYRSISFSQFLILMLCGMSILFLLVLARGYQQEGKLSLIDVAMDLIINNRNSFVSIEYVNYHGFTYGTSMLSSFLAPIPFLQNIVVKLFGIDSSEMASSIVITKMTFGEVSELGLGTNIIADIYMSFGPAGVVILMSGLGYFISLTLDKAKHNIYAMVCYGVMLSYAVFLVRAEFFFFLRFLTWCLLIVYLSRLYRIKFKFLDKDK